MKKLHVYDLQNAAIHQARVQLESKGILTAGSGLDQIRDLAAELNGGIRSISALSLEQRRTLIDILNGKGAAVRNPGVYESDLKGEAQQFGKKRKVVRISALSEKTQRLIDTLAAQINWPNYDSFDKLCVKLFTTTRPRNAKESRQVIAILKSMIKRQNKEAGDAGVEEKTKRRWRRKEPKAKTYPSYSCKHTDSRGREREFILSVMNEIGGVYNVRAKERRAEQDKGGYEFNASSPDLKDAFAQLQKKVADGLARFYTEIRDGRLSFNGIVKGRIACDGVCIDGEFIPADKFCEMLSTYEGWPFSLVIEDND